MENVLDFFSLSEFVARDVVGVQVLVLAATGAVFALSLALAVIAGRAAGRAGRARAEADACLRQAQDLVVEARQLTSQMDRANARNAAGGAIGGPMRVSARHSTPDADVEIERIEHNESADRNLGAAAESASVPKGLLRFRRR